QTAGILLESGMPAAGVAGPASGPGVIAVGIGINLGQREFPASLAARATSVLRETERMVDRDVMLTALLEAFDGWRACLERDGLAPIRARWLVLAHTTGRTVSVEGTAGRARE